MLSDAEEDLQNYSLSFEEANVDDRRVEVNKLEDKHFEDQLVIKFCLRSVHLWNRKKILFIPH